MKMAKKSKKSLMELLHEEEENKTLFNEAEANGNNGKESESAQTDTGVSGDVKDAEYGGLPETGSEQTDDPVKASDEILQTLSDYKSELPADLLTGGPEFEAKPRKRGRRSKAEIEKEKAEQASAIVVPPELFVFVCDHGTAHAFALIDKLITKKGKPTIQPEQIALREGQAEKLYPVAQKCIEAMKLSDDPIRAFFGSLLAIQFTNYLMIKSTIK
jgi:hypothetical protein